MIVILIGLALTYRIFTVFDILKLEINFKYVKMGSGYSVGRESADGAQHLADLISNSSKIVFVTGAGISTCNFTAFD